MSLVAMESTIRDAMLRRLYAVYALKERLLPRWWKMDAVEFLKYMW